MELETGKMIQEYIIISERTNIRRVVSNDWRAMKQIWEDQAKSPYAMYDILHNTDEENVKNRISKWSRYVDGNEHIFLAICLKNATMIGFISFNLHGNEYDIGYGFKKEFQGNGYARESLKSAILNITTPGIIKFTAGTALKNEPSVKLLSSVGFHLIRTEQVTFYKDEENNPIYFEGGLYELTVNIK